MASATVLLQQKREQLEQEIADFARRKEDEYKSFEQQYLSGIPNDDRFAGNGIGTRSIGMSGKLRDQDHILQEKSAKRGTPAEDAALRPNAGETATREVQATSKETMGDTRSYEEGSGRDALSFAQRNEREPECKVLFTPMHLPLLGGHEQGASVGYAQDRRHSGIEQSISMDQQRASSNKQQTTLSLSSSATFPSDHMRSSGSPPSVRSLSASVPKKPSHHRSLSSRSDISITSLRSSLRDPKQPRSPKRVLFSLDNGVVSPSTSPIAKRTQPCQNVIPVETLSAPQLLGSSGPAATGSSRSANNASASSNLMSNDSSVNGITNGKIDSSSSFIKGSGIADASSLIAGDDFERIDTDEELFAFDEDIDNADADAEIQMNMEDDIGSEEEEQDGQPLTASSPHAGSLPIEIKWPPKLGGQR